MPVKCEKCGKTFVSQHRRKEVCCGQSISVPSEEYGKCEAERLASRVHFNRTYPICASNRCGYFGGRGNSVGCLKLPVVDRKKRPCGIVTELLHGKGCFDREDPQFEPGSITGWKAFQQPSLDDHCIAVTSLSRLDHHRARQTACLDSWRKFGLSIIAVNQPAEMELLQDAYPQVDRWIENDVPNENYERHMQRIKHLANVATVIDQTILLINSDIEIYGGQGMITGPMAEGKQVVGIRWNYPENDYESAERERWGLDAFSFTPELARSLPELDLTIGRPMWDYWIPLHSRISNQPMEFIGQRLFYHQSHNILWSQDDWHKGAKIVSDHYSYDFGPMAEPFRNSLPYPPDAEANDQ